jgi:hypothetical protein
MASDAMHTIGQKKSRQVYENQRQQLGCDGTLHEQGNDYAGWSSGVATALGLDVTSCSNENPSMRPFFPVAYLK